jgi:uncharacterized protein (TIGR03435 family)
MAIRSWLTAAALAVVAPVEASHAHALLDGAQGGQQFEVVSIKPTEPGSRGGPGPFVNTTPGRLNARGTLGFFIEYAYGINGTYVEGGPGWLRSDRFDIDARQPPGSESFPLMLDMLRAALADRFKLIVRQQRRELPVLLLTVAKGGPKLTPSAADDEAQTRGRPGELIATKISMAGLASQLSRSVGRIVQDRTGLQGFYNVTLRATNEGFERADPLERGVADPGAPSIGTALEEQLGLKLESGRGPVDVLIIDRAERPAAD